MTTVLPYGSGPGRGRPGPILAVAGVALLAVLGVGAIVASGGTPGGSPNPAGGASAARGGAGGSPAAADSTAGGASDAAPASSGIPGGPLVGPGGSSVPGLTPGASTGATLLPSASGPFPGGLMIADRGNGRILIVNNMGKVLWRFPVRGSLPKGQGFSADDAFLSPDGKTIAANEEQRQVVVRIDIATRKIVWEYGHYGVIGSAPGYLNTPDDSYPLANGDVMIADIFNCRIIEVSPAKKIVRQWGHTRVCDHRPGYDYNQPNGDTPLPDGGLLITEIRGSRVVRLGPDGTVVFDIHVPVAYPSDAQLDPQGNVVVADYSTRGAVVSVSPAGKLLWRYSPASGPRRLDHPSLAVPRADGTVVLNDDFRHRVLLIDPKTGVILWQYGVTDRRGTGASHLFLPDGLDQLPAGLFPGA